MQAPIELVQAPMNLVQAPMNLVQVIHDRHGFDNCGINSKQFRFTLL
jgi:hypothetical protein